MNEDLHQRAEKLKIESLAGELSDPDRQWLGTHLESCPSCVNRSRDIEEAVQVFRSVTVRVDPELVRRTRLNVHARARIMGRWGVGRVSLWVSFALSGMWMTASILYFWRSFERIAAQLGIPNWIWEMGFGLWWAMPLLIVAVILSLQPHRGNTEEESLLSPR